MYSAMTENKVLVNSMDYSVYLLMSLALMPISLELKAENNLKHHYRAATHIHGLARLTIALQGPSLELQLETPAANLIGFEHIASTAKEKHVLEDTITLLKSPEKLFSFNGSHCIVQNMTVDLSGVLHEALHDHHSQSNVSEDHDGHSEITANYLFKCDQSVNLQSVSIALIKQFPGLEKINTLWVTESQQGSDTLTNTNDTIHFR